MSRHRATYVPLLDAPSPVLGFALIGAFLSALWLGIGFIAGAMVGFPS